MRWGTWKRHLAAIAMFAVVSVAGCLLVAGGLPDGEDSTAAPVIQPGARPTTTTTTTMPPPPTTTPWEGAPTVPLYGAATFGVTSSGCSTGQWKLRVVRSWGNAVVPESTPCNPVSNCTEQADRTVYCGPRPMLATGLQPLVTMGALNASDFVVTEGRSAWTDSSGALLHEVPQGHSCSIGGDTDPLKVGCTLVIPGLVTYSSWDELYALVETFAASFQSQVFMFGKLG